MPFEFFHKVTSESEASPIEAALNEESPYELPGWGYLFGTHLWELTKEDELADEEQRRLLFLEAIDKERRKFERLRRKFDGTAGEPVYNRESIPVAVRRYVWRRDEGKCVKCGSQERLEYDHIIPRSKGGSNTERNIQLLCERCNREKRDNI